MKFNVDRRRIVVVPENKQDEAYIEDTLGLRKDGDYVLLKRTNASGLSSIAYLETAIAQDEETARLRETLELIAGMEIGHGPTVARETLAALAPDEDQRNS